MTISYCTPEKTTKKSELNQKVNTWLENAWLEIERNEFVHHP